jgi:hypothetical protein
MLGVTNHDRAGVRGGENKPPVITPTAVVGFGDYSDPSMTSDEENDPILGPVPRQPHPYLEYMFVAPMNLEIRTPIVLNVRAEDRALTVSWMYQIFLGFGFADSAFHIAVDIFDRAASLSDMATPQDFYRLAITSLWMASKMEDTIIPTLENLVFLTRGVCSREEIIECEMRITNLLSFHLIRATDYSHMQLFERPDAGDDAKVMNTFLSVAATLMIDVTNICPNLVTFCIMGITASHFGQNAEWLMRNGSPILEFGPEEIERVTRAICEEAAGILIEAGSSPLYAAFVGMCEERALPVPHFDASILGL